jgi:hypothetical protein
MHVRGPLCPTASDHDAGFDAVLAAVDVLAAYR